MLIEFNKGIIRPGGEEQFIALNPDDIASIAPYTELDGWVVITMRRGTEHLCKGTVKDLAKHVNTALLAELVDPEGLLEKVETGE